MKVVLRQAVEGLGAKGDVREVKPGFGRNFLLVRELAWLEDDPQAAQLLRVREEELKKEKAAEQQAAEVAVATEGKAVDIKVKVGDKQQLFAAVGQDEIKKAVKEQLKVEPEEVTGAPLNKLGDHEVQLRFGHGKAANIIVKLEGSGGGAKKK